ncbi:MAG: UDP-glucose 4-epimerase GalE [Pseudomonadota bacterium]
MTTTVLLTGGAGYIGSHTFVALVEAGYSVVIVDDFSNSNPSVIGRLGRLTGLNRISFYEGSVLDHALMTRIFQAHAFDAVVHFAAKKAVGESVSHPIDYIDTNIGGLTTLLKVMQDHDVRRLVFSSSATVYGTPEVIPIPETSARSFTSPYAFTKLMGEHVLEQAATADASWVFGILRYFNPVGAHPSGTIGEDPGDIPNNLMPYIAKVATGELPHLNVFGDDYDTPDGTGVRDYVHVCDLAEGHVKSLDALIAQNTGHTVNLGTGVGTSVLEMLQAYAAACGKDLPHVIAPRRDGDVPVLCADVGLARDLLGFEATRSLEDMCNSSWHWMQTGAQEGDG